MTLILVATVVGVTFVIFLIQQFTIKYHKKCPLCAEDSMSGGHLVAFDMELLDIPRGIFLYSRKSTCCITS